MRRGARRDHRIHVAVGTAAAVMSTVITGCGGPANDPSSSGSGSGSGSTSGDFPVTIENCGRSLTFEEPPSRVLSSYQPNLEVLIGLGLADRVIARAEYLGAEDVPLPADQQAELDAIPVEQSGGDGFTRLPTKEAAITLAPDFVQSGGFYEMEPTEGFATREEWQAAGAPTYLAQCSLDQGDDITVEDTYQYILDMGRIFGVEDEAQARVDEMKERIAAVQDAVAGVDPVDTLIVYTTDDPPYLQGSSIEGRLLELAGGRNVLADEPQSFPANDEAVAALDVEAYLTFPAYGPDVEALFERYPNLQASQDQRVITTNYALTGGGVAGAWRIDQAVEEMARQLHPAQFD